MEQERASVAELPDGEEKKAVVVRLREKEARTVVAADVEKERASVAELPEGEEKEAGVVRLREKEARAVVAADVEKERGARGAGVGAELP